jgi:hypothetical protein
MQDGSGGPREGRFAPPDHALARMVGEAHRIVGPDGDAAKLLALRLNRGRPEDRVVRRWVEDTDPTGR